MAYPDPPQKSTSYTAVAQAQGDGSLPGPALDVDLDELVRSVEDLLQFIRGVIRSDGRLQNAIVKRENLGADIALGFDAPTEWAAGTEYEAGNTAFFAGGFYLATQTHTAGQSFTTDLNSGRWTLLVDLAPAGALVASLNLSDLDDAATARTNLGLGSLATSELVPISKGGTGATSIQGVRIALGLGDAATADIGSEVQAYSAELSALAVLASTTFGRGFLTLVDAAAARQKLELGGLATQNVIDEDDFATDSATRPPSQQSVKAFVEGYQPGIGYGQSWTNQTPNRAADVVYTNGTPRPIMVAIHCNQPSVAQIIDAQGGVVEVARGIDTGADNTTINFIVPPGIRYRLSGGNFEFWSELR